ncbi:MAG: L,D-transpeptidase [Bauldia sp.]|nr:L,D-transpeptidase [Bauldia sp.]
MPGKKLRILVTAIAVSIAVEPAEAGFFKDLFANLGNEGGSYYPEQVSRSRMVPFRFRRQVVSYKTSEKPGTIIIDARQHYLYYVLASGKAVRYGVGVGRDGFGWKGTVTVGGKAEWPTWTPPPEMVVRERKRGRILPAQMKGGPRNPLGARALYLYKGGNDTTYRIHGTSEPWTIGLNVSSGCIRLVNDDIIDLYKRARVGAKVVVL